LKGYLANL